MIPVLLPQEEPGQDSPPPADILSGYVNVLKPPGLTSHDVVARLRRWSGQPRVGHTGTLDPSAVGVLPVAIGRATRTTGSPVWDRKLYWADVRFGTSTTTDDADGEILLTGNPEGLEAAALVGALEAFVGDVLQRPPAYSAVHVEGGERAYRTARRGVQTELPVRSARVDAVTVVGWAPPVLSILLQCRSGTYVRSIARDLGTAVRCPAHLSALVRLRVGPFAIDDALDLETLAALSSDGWERILWPVDMVDGHADAVIVGPGRREDFAHGRSWRSAGLDSVGAANQPAGARVYTSAGEFLGFARRIPDGSWTPSPRLHGAAP